VIALLGVVLAGLDVVAAGGAPVLGGKRVGLVAHAASVTADGVHAIDVLRSRGVVLLRLFAPEHGLRGEAAAGAVVADRLEVAGPTPRLSARPASIPRSVPRASARRVRTPSRNRRRGRRGPPEANEHLDRVGPDRRPNPPSSV
jgi:hypothetical protein